MTRQGFLGVEDERDEKFEKGKYSFNPADRYFVNGLQQRICQGAVRFG